MNKQLLHSEDIVAYDTSIKAAVEHLDAQHPGEHVIAIFGGAIWEDTHNINLEQFSKHLVQLAHNAVFFKWHKGIVDAMRTYCHLCYIDPALIECYWGQYFDEFAKLIEA